MKNDLVIIKGCPLEYLLLVELENGLFCGLREDPILKPHFDKIQEILLSRMPNFERDGVPDNFDLVNVEVAYTYRPTFEDD